MITRAHVAAILLGVTLPTNDVLPPEKFQGDAVAVLVSTSSQQVVEKECGLRPKGKIIACAEVGKQGGLVVMPNPCVFSRNFPEQELYATLLCHELGHINGWTHK